MTSIPCVCSCFFSKNIFLTKYKLHVSYINIKDFLERYTKIKNEVSRRNNLGEASLKRINRIQELYEPLHSDAYTLREDYFEDSFLSLVSRAKMHTATKESLLEVMEVVGDGVYAFPLFKPRFCKLLTEEMSNIEQSQCPSEQPNTMNKLGILLGEYGFNHRLLDVLRLDYITPISALLFHDCGGARLDSHRAFSVSYRFGQHENVDLSCHYDNSEVSLNVSLNGSFTGGHLFFRAPSNTVLGEEGVSESQQWQQFFYNHREGLAVIHRGQLNHGAVAIGSGRRDNLIMWMRASSVRNMMCPMCMQKPCLRSVPGLDDGFRQLRSDEQGL